MRRPASNASVVLLSFLIVPILIGAGCATSGTSKKAETKNLFLKVFVDNNGKPVGPADISVAVNDKQAINRTFSLGRDSYDGQYVLNLPKGRYTIRAESHRAGAQITHSFTINNDLYIELYLTKEGKLHLTPKSKLSIARFVFKKTTKPPAKNANPALWQRMPSLAALPSSTPQESNSKTPERRFPWKRSKT